MLNIYFIAVVVSLYFLLSLVFIFFKRGIFYSSNYLAFRPWPGPVRVRYEGFYCIRINFFTIIYKLLRRNNLWIQYHIILNRTIGRFEGGGGLEKETISYNVVPSVQYNIALLSATRILYLSYSFDVIVLLLYLRLAKHKYLAFYKLLNYDNSQHNCLLISRVKKIITWIKLNLNSLLFFPFFGLFHFFFLVLFHPFNFCSQSLGLRNQYEY